MGGRSLKLGTEFFTAAPVVSFAPRPCLEDASVYLIASLKAIVGKVADYTSIKQFWD